MKMPDTEPMTTLKAFTWNEKANSPTAPAHQRAKAWMISHPYPTPSGAPSTIPTSASASPSHASSRPAICGVKPVARRMPYWLARRSIVSRSSNPTRPAAEATRNMLMAKNSTPKSVEPFDAANACSRTGRNVMPNAASRSRPSRPRRTCSTLAKPLTQTAVTQAPAGSSRPSSQRFLSVSSATMALGVGPKSSQYASSLGRMRLMSIGKGGSQSPMFRASVMPSKSGTILLSKAVPFMWTTPTSLNLRLAVRSSPRAPAT